MNRLITKTQKILAVLIIVNIVCTGFLYLSKASYYNVSLVLLSIELFISLDLTFKSQNAEFARTLALKYTLSALLSTFISFTLVGVIKGGVSLEYDIVILVNIAFISFYHAVYFISLFTQNNLIPALRGKRLTYLYWIISGLVVVFILIRLIKL